MSPTSTDPASAAGSAPANDPMRDLLDAVKQDQQKK
jgi:hypothetical protein